jgi:hypothetical protein
VAKLTLSVDGEVIARAKGYARQHGLTISKMVETYLDTVVEPPVASIDTPVLRAVRGILKDVDLDDYRDHLAEKYR